MSILQASKLGGISLLYICKSKVGCEASSVHCHMVRYKQEQLHLLQECTNLSRLLHLFHILVSKFEDNLIRVSLLSFLLLCTVQGVEVQRMQLKEHISLDM